MFIDRFIDVSFLASGVPLKIVLMRQGRGNQKNRTQAALQTGCNLQRDRVPEG